MDPTEKVAEVEISPKSARLYAIDQQVTFSTTITTEAGTPGQGIAVAYKSRNEALVTVNSSGVATAKTKGGTTYIVATAGEKSDSALVEVPTTSCGATAATSLGVGEVATDITGNFCATASTGEYTVFVHNNSLAASGNASIEIQGIALGVPPSDTAPAIKATKSSIVGPQLHAWRRDVAYEMRHRLAEQQLAATIPGGGRTWYESQRRNRASLAASAQAVGDIMSINVNIGGNGCTDTPTLVDARVAAVSNAAIVLADPRNPSNGLTDAEYNEYAQMFDSIVNPLDVSNFGAPTDLDANAKIILVFTRSINERTPAGADFYVGGLTHSRDLLAKAGCAGSNFAEMFYLLAADPGGSINGNAFDKEFIKSVTDATIAHEYQHLINFARRRYLNPGAPQASEELWMNEGLSHVAEELLFYRRTARTPRSNLGFSATVLNASVFTPFRDYMAGNFLNYDEYVFRPTETSPFEAGDALATRGASWAFLRYAADHKFSTDGSLWMNLVNSGEAGATNLQNRLGIDAAGLRAMLRDFTIALYTDDFVADAQTGAKLPVESKYTHPSWDMRSIYPGLQNFPPWPLNGAALKDAQTRSNTVQAGALKPYRFKGITGADAFIRVTGSLGSALPSGITISVVRTK